MKEVLFNTHDVALLITIYQCLLFAIFLITLKKGKKLSNILLAGFLICNAAIPLDTLINFGAAFRTFAIDLSPNLFYIFGTGYWLESVFLLFYIRSLIYKDFKFKKTDALYLVPFLYFITFEYSNWLFADPQAKLDFLNGYVLAEQPPYTYAVNLFRECFREFCGIMCLIELRHYQKQIKNNFSDIETIDLTWLKILIIGFLIVHAQAVIVTLGYISVFQLNVYIDYELIGLIANYTILLWLSFLIYFSLGFSTVFQGIEKEPKAVPEKDPIDESQVNAITDYMVVNKPYLNQLLTLENLAKQLSIAPRMLSQIINRHFKQNFFEFINSYRIDEAKNILSLPENKKITMLDVMDQAGFNSKATFNTFFKKLVGMTPTEYKKIQQK